MEKKGISHFRIQCPISTNPLNVRKTFIRYIYKGRSHNGIITNDLHTHKNKCSLLASKWFMKTFNIHETFLFHKMFFMARIKVSF